MASLSNIWPTLLQGETLEAHPSSSHHYQVANLKASLILLYILILLLCSRIQNLLHSLPVSLVGGQVEAEIPAVLVIDVNYVADVGPEVGSLCLNLQLRVS